MPALKGFKKGEIQSRISFWYDRNEYKTGCSYVEHRRKRYFLTTEVRHRLNELLDTPGVYNLLIYAIKGLPGIKFYWVNDIWELGRNDYTLIDFEITNNFRGYASAAVIKNAEH